MSLAQDAPDAAEMAEMSLPELLDIEVTTPTRTRSKLTEAPATVIVLTREQLDERGYRVLADILDDLPGMDITRGWGDNWYVLYWRGNRSFFVPYLVMLDGQVMNELWTHDDAHHLVGYPLASVERVEIVYGPSSVIYGRNAFAGVINVITTKGKENGAGARLSVTTGSHGRRVADGAVSYRQDELSMRASFHLETGLVDDRTNDQYEFTRNRYYNDRALWGEFLDNPAFADFHSRHRFAGADLRLRYGGTELGGYWLSHVSGYGVVYAGDRVLNNATWYRRELSLHLRHDFHLGEHVDASVGVRYRESGFPNQSAFIDGFTDPMLGRLVAFSYWQSQNYSWSAFQDFNIRLPVDGLSVSAGFEYVLKDLTKSYEITGTDYTPVAEIDLETFPFPDPPDPARRPQNRILTEDAGAYAEVKYALTTEHVIHAGARLDHNSEYGFAPTFRGGYVGRVAEVVVLKALYGEAFQEPTARTLYGGWTGAGSDPDLEPERLRSVELGGSLNLSRLVASLTAYYSRTTNIIEVGSFEGMSYARNLGHRDVVSSELGVQGFLPVPYLARVRGWLYYTRIFLKEEERFNAVLGERETGSIGDLADDKVQAGLTTSFDEHFTLTLRGRFIGRRRPVYTNPVDRIDPFVTLDTHLLCRDLVAPGLTLGLSVQNLTDTRYVHPGYADAAAGIDAAAGSASLYSSLLPQPGISVLFSLALERW